MTFGCRFCENKAREEKCQNAMFTNICIRTIAFFILVISCLPFPLTTNPFALQVDLFKIHRRVYFWLASQFTNDYVNENSIKAPRKCNRKITALAKPNEVRNLYVVYCDHSWLFRIVLSILFLPTKHKRSKEVVGLFIKCVV